MIRKKRSIPMTVLLGLLAAGCLALAVYLAIVIVPQAKGAWLGVAVFGLLGAFLLLGAIGAVVQEADCPGCGRALSLSGEEGERIACNQCYALAERRGEGLIALSDDFVSPATDVGLWLLPGMKIPGVCVACGAPATRFEEMRSTKVEAGAAIATLAGSLPGRRPDDRHAGRLTREGRHPLLRCAPRRPRAAIRRGHLLLVGAILALRAGVGRSQRADAPDAPRRPEEIQVDARAAVVRGSRRDRTSRRIRTTTARSRTSRPRPPRTTPPRCRRSTLRR